MPYTITRILKPSAYHRISIPHNRISHPLRLSTPHPLQQAQHPDRAPRRRGILPPRHRGHHGRCAIRACHCHRLRRLLHAVIQTTTPCRLDTRDRPPIIRASPTRRLHARDRPAIVCAASTCCLHACDGPAVVGAAAAGCFDGGLLGTSEELVLG